MKRLSETARVLCLVFCLSAFSAPAAAGKIPHLFLYEIEASSVDLKLVSKSIQDGQYRGKLLSTAINEVLRALKFRTVIVADTGGGQYRFAHGGARVVSNRPLPPEFRPLLEAAICPASSPAECDLTAQIEEYPLDRMALRVNGKILTLDGQRELGLQITGGALARNSRTQSRGEGSIAASPEMAALLTKFGTIYSMELYLYQHGPGMKMSEPKEKGSFIYNTAGLQ